MKISRLTVGPFEENTYLVVDDGDAVLVDPGDEAERILSLVAQCGATLRAIWVTHGHLDHIGAIAAVKRVYDVSVFLHPTDLPLYQGGARQAAYYGLPFEQPPDPDRTLAEGDTVSVGASHFGVWHLPGHAPGHVAFVRDGIVLGGDVLFQGSIGRTDLPMSDAAAMERSLARLSRLPEETVVYPGHGPLTTIGAEVASNPFLVGVARPVKSR